jgi:hypothetical protein
MLVSPRNPLQEPVYGKIPNISVVLWKFNHVSRPESGILTPS